MNYVSAGIPDTLSVSGIFTVHQYSFSGRVRAGGEAHDFPELIYVIRGKHSLSLDSRPYELSAGQLMIYEPNGEGCTACGGTGYFGRIGVYEIMPVTNDLRIKIAAGARADELKACAVSEGMHTLKDGGVRLCLEGITSFKEALKIAYESE